MPGPAIFDLHRSAVSERVHRIRVTGELDATTGPRLISSLGRARQQADRLCLDLSGVTFIDCSGLTALLRAVRNARRSGCDLEVDEQVSRPVQRMIEMAGLDRLFWP